MQVSEVTRMDAAPAAKAADGSFRTAATSRGATNSMVSSQWWHRPDDQRFVTVDDLYAATKSRHGECGVTVAEAAKMKFIASSKPEDEHKLAVEVPNLGELSMTNWGFGQLCRLVGAPVSYLADRHACLTALNLQYDFTHDRRETLKVLDRKNADESTMLAATSETYGRIWDYEIVGAARELADRAGFKVPGEIDWSSGNGKTFRYDPEVPTTKRNTTLFASDRDVFLFLVQDRNPIVIGKLPNGEDDIVFRGFYARNSEVGYASAQFGMMYLRGVCCNRMLWGVEGFTEISIRHSKFAPERFAETALPKMREFANASTNMLIDGVNAAKAKVVARDDDSRKEFLAGLKISQKRATDVLDHVEREEGHKAKTVWDFVQGLTATARDLPHNDARLDMERVAGKLLDKVAA